MLTRPETSLGRHSKGRKQQGKVTQENCYATWFTVWGFMVTGLVSELSLGNHSDSGSFLLVPALLSQDGVQQEGFWEAGRIYGLESPLAF